jgi:hypothetical protein
MLCSIPPIYPVLNFFLKCNERHSQISNATNPITLLAVSIHVREIGGTNISFVTSVPVEDVRSDWTNFREVLYWADSTILVGWWSELLTTNHEVPGSIPGSTVENLPCRGRSP